MTLFYKKIEAHFNRLAELPDEVIEQEIQRLSSEEILTLREIEELKILLSLDHQSDGLTISNKASQSVVGDSLDDVPTINKYQIIKPLGTGGMGQVFLAKNNDESFEHLVAIKCAHGYLSPEDTKKFITERQILASLKHPNIAQIFDGGSDLNGKPYLAMEYVSGDDIISYVVKTKASLKECIGLVLQICQAVAYAHSKLILHRDLKPDNIWVTDDGVVKLLDFGIAKSLVENDSSTHFTRIMTRRYASPEQIKGESLTIHSDLFSLGIIAFELLTGCHPFRNKTEYEREQNVISGNATTDYESFSDDQVVHVDIYSQVKGALHTDLQSIINKALNPEIRYRYNSADAFAQDLRNYLENKPVSARVAGLTYHLHKFIRRNFISSLMAFIFSVALMITTWISINQAQIARNQKHQAELTSTFLEKIFIDSNNYQSKTEVQIGDVLEQGLMRVASSTELFPSVKYRIIKSIHESLWSLAMYELSGQHIEDNIKDCYRELGEEDVQCIWLLMGSYRPLLESERLEEAIAVLKKAEQAANLIKNNELLVEIYSAQMLILTNMFHYQEAQAAAEQSVYYATLADGSVETIIGVLNDLAISYISTKDFTSAEKTIARIPQYLNRLDVHQRVDKESSFYGLWGYFYAVKGDIKMSFTNYKNALNTLTKYYVKETPKISWYYNITADAAYRSNNERCTQRQYVHMLKFDLIQSHRDVISCMTTFFLTFTIKKVF